MRRKFRVAWWAALCFSPVEHLRHYMLHPHSGIPVASKALLHLAPSSTSLAPFSAYFTTPWTTAGTILPQAFAFPFAWDAPPREILMVYSHILWSLFKGPFSGGRSAPPYLKWQTITTFPISLPIFIFFSLVKLFNILYILPPHTHTLY